MKTLVATGGDLALRWLPRSSAGRRAAACCCDEESCCELPPSAVPLPGAAAAIPPHQLPPASPRQLPPQPACSRGPSSQSPVAATARPRRASGRASSP